MEQSQSITELAKALVKVQAELKPAPKDSENPFFKSSYADLATVSKTVFPVLSKHGLSVSQVAEGEGAVTTILMHESGEWLKGTLSLKPTKNDPQGMGSAITYARRYALASICGLATEDDDGNEASKPEPKPRPTAKGKKIGSALAKIEAAMFPADCDQVIDTAQGYLDKELITEDEFEEIKIEALKKRRILEGK